MLTDTDGIILKQIRLPDERRMLVVFTRKYGKINAGTNIRLNGKNKSSLALRVFTHGRYEIYSNRESYNINSAETLESYYKIGEDVDKYMYSSYVLEFTEKMLQDGQPSEKILDTLLDFLSIVQNRKNHLKSLVLVYQWKLVQLCGYMPYLDGCVKCGRTSELNSFSVSDGGMLCDECKKSGTVNLRLLYSTKFDIIKTLKFIEQSNMKSFEKLAVNEEVSDYMSEILKEYVSYHMGIDKLKSESYLKI